MYHYQFVLILVCMLLAKRNTFFMILLDGVHRQLLEWVRKSEKHCESSNATGLFPFFVRVDIQSVPYHVAEP